MIHGYLREIDDLVATKELQIHLAIQSPAFINGNKLLIEKVFSNLISNAVKYSPHGASVDIILQNTNGRFLFSVENTGTHIPEDDIPKLFDAFYRMEQSRSRRTGGRMGGFKCIVPSDVYELATLQYPYEIKTNDVETYRNAHLFSHVKNIYELQKNVGVDVACRT